MRKFLLLSLLLAAAAPLWALEIKSSIGKDGRTVDDINLPFVDDKEAIGTWTAVDFVAKPGDFEPGKKDWGGDLYLKELVFMPGGKSPNGWLTWTKGVVMHAGDRTASRYEIKKIGGADYMFFEWKSGDYTLRHKAPEYYVLKKTSAIKRDDIDLPFKDDPAVVGEWTSVDFVETPEKFDPAARAWNGDLYLKSMTFLPGGKGGKEWWHWTKGRVIVPADHTAAAYEIRKIKGTEYLFFEWKSGDYILRGMKPNYYVLKRK